MLQTQAFEKTEMAKIEQRQLEAEGAQLIQAAKVAVEKQKVEILYAKTMAEVEALESKQDLEQQRIAAEDAKTAVELAIKFGAQITTNH